MSNLLTNERHNQAMTPEEKNAALDEFFKIFNDDAGEQE